MCDPEHYISCDSLTDAEAALGGVVELGSTRSLAAVWSLENADRILASLPYPYRFSFYILGLERGRNAHLVTDGHWYVG